jgi:hypothetical protein
MLHDKDPSIAQHTMQRVPVLVSNSNILSVLFDPADWRRGDGSKGQVGAVVPTRQLSDVACGVDDHSLFNFLSLKVVGREVLRDLARDSQQTIHHGSHSAVTITNNSVSTIKKEAIASMLHWLNVEDCSRTLRRNVLRDSILFSSFDCRYARPTDFPGKRICCSMSTPRSGFCCCSRKLFRDSKSLYLWVTIHAASRKETCLVATNTSGLATVS